MYLDNEKWGQAFAELCPEISDLLDTEINAGNRIKSVYRAEQTEMGGWLKIGTIIVNMENNFSVKSSLPANVLSGGPDYQCGIYRFHQCSLHQHMLMESRIN